MNRKPSSTNDFADFIRGSLIFLKFLLVVGILILLVSVVVAAFTFCLGILPYMITVAIIILGLYILYRFLAFLGANARQQKEKDL